MNDQSANSASTEKVDPKLLASHQAIFYLWLPLDDLDLPADVKADIAKIAGQVCSRLFIGLSDSPAQKALLQGMTYPNLLPFYEQIKSSKDPAVVDFGKNGFGGMDAKNRKALFSWLFDGPGCPASAQIAMALREIYLSTIWDAPLALPLTQTGESPVFVSNPAIWAKLNYPKLPASRLAYDPKTNVVAAKKGKIDYLVIGSGPGGAMTAHELQKAGKNVVLIERGNYIVWGSMNIMSCADLMFQRNQAFTTDHGIVIRSGEAVGGGSTVNVDLAFSPLESTILTRIQYWISQGWANASDYSIERLSAAYQYVREKLETREVEQDELNQDNLVLWRGSQAFGITPSLYHLNRFATGESPSPVTQKRDPARQLLSGPIQDAHNLLSLIPNADVDEILFSGQGENLKATGVSFIATEPWTAHGNACV
ncbi:MAG: GMC family oxidoreductase N-terminal domain-containing protein [Terriglobales bacterium]